MPTRTGGVTFQEVDYLRLRNNDFALPGSSLGGLSVEEEVFKAICLAALVVSAIPLSGAQAATTILTFNGRNCGSALQTVECGTNQSILQSYGDGDGVDVLYRAVTAAGDLIGNSLEYRATGSGNLSGAIFSNTGPGAAGEVLLQVLRGYELTLLGFDSGCRNNASNCRSLPYRISEIGGSITANGTLSNPVGGRATATFDLPYSRTGYILKFGPDGFNGAIDNIAFDVRALAAVPEPSIWAMLILGFGFIGLAHRRIIERRPRLRSAGA